MTVELPLQSQTSNYQHIYVEQCLLRKQQVLAVTQVYLYYWGFVLLAEQFASHLAQSLIITFPVLRANISQLQIIISLPSSQWKICPMIASLILTCLDAATFFPNPTTFSTVILEQFLCRNGLEWFRNWQLLRIWNWPISCIFDNNSTDWSWESGAPVMNGAAVRFHG